MKRIIPLLLVTVMLVSTVCVATFAEEAYKLGDVNRDGYTNLSDASAIMKYIAGWELTERQFDLTLADVDKNEAVNLADVSLYMKYLAHWDDPFLRS